MKRFKILSAVAVSFILAGAPMLAHAAPHGSGGRSGATGARSGVSMGARGGGAMGGGARSFGMRSGIGGAGVNSGTRFSGARMGSGRMGAGVNNGWRGGNRYAGYRGYRGAGYGFAAGIGLGYYGSTYGGYYDAGYDDDQVVSGYSSDDASCAQRYRSYDPASGTYLGFDGERHPCP